jgi:hypothetical protein
MASNPLPDGSARHVPHATGVSVRKFSRLQTPCSAIAQHPGFHGKKTAETCPNMTVSADVRMSDGRPSSIGAFLDEVLEA